MIFRLLNILLHKCIDSSVRRVKEGKCEKCGVLMERQEKSYLFLLPIFHDDEYEITADYYMSHCRPIETIQEIPAGQRACKMEILQCPKCLHRDVQIEDFLQVRDTQLLEGLARYDYADFYFFFQNLSWEHKSAHDTNVAKKRESYMTERHLSDH